MTTATATAATAPVRVASYNGICGAPGCPWPVIKPGYVIVKPPGRPWQHHDCRKPGNRKGAR